MILEQALCVAAAVSVVVLIAWALAPRMPSRSPDE